MNPQAITDWLRDLAASQNLTQRALDDCRAWLDAPDSAADLEGWSPGELAQQFEKCSLTFQHHFWAEPFVETRIGLYVADPTGVSFEGLLSVGHYRLITHLDGTDWDEYLVIYESRREWRESL